MSTVLDACDDVTNLRKEAAVEHIPDRSVRHTAERTVISMQRTAAV
jgi:hypothetical protein